MYILKTVSCLKVLLGEVVKLGFFPERLMKKNRGQTSQTVTGKEREESETELAS